MRSFLLIGILLLGLLSDDALGQRRGGRMRLDESLTKSSRELKGAFRDVIAEAVRSTGLVRCDGETVGYGTVVSSDGYLVTKASELDGPTHVRFSDGREYTATIVGVVISHDLALLKIDARDLAPVEWADVGNVKVGELLATVGQSNVPVAMGVLSVGRRKIPGGSAIMGVMLEDTEDGVRIAQVSPDSGAAEAGLRTNDIILSIDGEPARNREEVTTPLGFKFPGDSVVVRVRRDGEEIETTVTLSKRPEIPGDAGRARSRFQNSMGKRLSTRANGFPAVFSHDTVLNADQCGGPVVRLDGKAIGINIAVPGRIETYALPADVIQSVLPDLIAGKYPASTQPTTSPSSRPMPEP